jgi:hypothetical protein
VRKAHLYCFLGLFVFEQGFAAGTKVFEYDFGRELQTVPTVDHEGTIFLGGKGAVAAVNPAGVEKWKIELSPGSQADVGGITAGESRLYVTSSQGLYALDKTGVQIWTNGLNLMNASVALEGTNHLYVVDRGGILWALRADGSTRWTNSAEANPLFETINDFAPAVGPNGMIFTSLGFTVGFSNTGEQLWKVLNGGLLPSPVVNEDGSIYLVQPSPSNTGSEAVRLDTNGVAVWTSSPIEGGQRGAAPVIGPDKTLYVPTIVTQPGGPGLTAFDGNGGKLWDFRDFSVPISPAVADDGTIYVSSGEVVAALSSSGARVWSYTNGVPIVKALNIGIDGSVVFSQTDGKLIALSAASPVADGVWPVYGRDPKHSFLQRTPVTFTIPRVERIGTNSALFRAEVNPQGSEATVFFEYSTGTSVARTAAREIGATNGNVSVSQGVSGLNAGTLYTVRLVSSNAFGLSRSSQVSFSTLGEPEELPPTLSSLQATARAGGTLRFSDDGVIGIGSSIEFTNNTVLDANGHRVVLTGNGQSSLLRIAPGAEITLKGLWLVEGRAASGSEGGSAVSKGGAIVNNSGHLTLIDCTLSNNVSHVFTPAQPAVAESAGGAIWQTGGSLVVRNCRFFNNTAAGDIFRPEFGSNPFFFNYFMGRGGAICLLGGSAEITASAFDGNQVSGWPSRGGAIYFADGAFVVAGSSLSRNRANTRPSGGAIYLETGRLTITNSTFLQNAAAASGLPGMIHSAFGAGLFNAGTTLVRNSTFLGNETIGEIKRNSQGSIVIGQSAGAGIYSTGTLGVENSTFRGNSGLSLGFERIAAGDASALYSAGLAGITNSTIAWNTNATSAVRGENRTNLVLKNTLLVGGRSVATAATFTDAGHNMSSDAVPFTESTSRTNVDARLGPIGYYGGNTLVHPLAAGSPAIDAADDSAAPAIDQRGRARPFGAHADVGAFESSPPFFVWGRVDGLQDPTTMFAIGTNSVRADASGLFHLGPLQPGAHEIAIAANNAVFLPNRLTVDLQADQELDAVTGFQLHTLTYRGTVDAPVFVLAGLAGETWKVESSTNLETWNTLGTFTLDASGLVEIPVPETTRLFLRVSAGN